MSDASVPETPAEMTANIELVLCSNCGQPVLLNSRFCSSCGTALAVGDTTALPPVEDSGPLPVIDPDAIAGLAPGEAALVIHRAPPRVPVSNWCDGLVTVGRGSDPRSSWMTSP